MTNSHHKLSTTTQVLICYRITPSGRLLLYVTQIRRLFFFPLPRNGSYLSFSYSKHIFRFSIDGYVSWSLCLTFEVVRLLSRAMTVRPRTSYFGKSVCRKSLDETRRTYWPHCLTVRSKSLRNLFEQFLSLSLHPRFSHLSEGRLTAGMLLLGDIRRNFRGIWYVWVVQGIIQLTLLGGGAATSAILATLSDDEI